MNPASRKSRSSRGTWAVEKNYVVDDQVIERIQQRARQKVKNSKKTGGDTPEIKGETYAAHKANISRIKRKVKERLTNVAPVVPPRIAYDYTCDICGKAFPDFDSAARCEARHTAAGGVRKA